MSGQGSKASARRSAVRRDPSRYSVRLRGEPFDKAVRLAGFRSDFSLAQAMGVNRSTVMRVRAGSLQPGPAFIGGALTVLAPMTFADLFEVVDSCA
ncbi:hypothetical protein GCM10009634_01620 [Saccharothrix xinjiangensis]